jgi:hypothetical protein
MARIRERAGRLPLVTGVAVVLVVVGLAFQVL